MLPCLMMEPCLALQSWGFRQGTIQSPQPGRSSKGTLRIRTLWCHLLLLHISPRDDRLEMAAAPLHPGHPFNRYGSTGRSLGVEGPTRWNRELGQPQPKSQLYYCAKWTNCLPPPPLVSERREFLCVGVLQPRFLCMGRCWPLVATGYIAQPVSLKAECGRSYPYF